MSERLCPCGCVLTWDQAVRATMRSCDLNYDQAEDLLVRAEAVAKEYRDGK